MMLSTGSSFGMIAILIGFFVLMMVMTIIPQRKQRKKMEMMMNSITVGDKILTIGGFVGVILSVDTESGRYVLNIGTEENETKVTVVKNAIRQKL